MLRLLVEQRGEDDLKLVMTWLESKVEHAPILFLSCAPHVQCHHPGIGPQTRRAV